MADDALLRLASITRVSAYRRRNDVTGKSVHVSSYLRKVHDAINSMGGPEVAAKQGINVNALQTQAAQADDGKISKAEFEGRLRKAVAKKTPAKKLTPEASKSSTSPETPAATPTTESSTAQSLESPTEQTQGFPRNFKPSYPDPVPNEVSPDWERDNKGRLVMTPQAHARHLDNVKARVDEALQKGMATDVAHKVDGPNGEKVWSPERSAMHKAIVQDLLAEARERGVGRNRRAVMSGGLGGSGKTTTLNSGSGINPNEFIELNPDAMKEELVKRGMAPDVPGVQPMEGAGLIHEESSDLAMMLAQAAQVEGLDVMWDITMASRGSVQKRLDMLKNDGYSTDAIFVDIPVETSVQRALDRHRRGASDYLARNEGLGGRFVDPRHIRANKPDDPRFNSNNRAVFEALKPEFSNWQLYDNSGDAPRKVDEAPPGARSKRADGYTYVKQGDGTWQRELPSVVAASRQDSQLDKLRLWLTHSNSSAYTGVVKDEYPVREGGA